MQINKCFYCMADMPLNTDVCPHCGKKINQIPQPEFALRQGTILHGKYLIGAVLGQGGFGITYIGLDLALGIKVAVKEYYPSNMATRSRSGSVLWSDRGIPKEEGCNNFLKEARKMARLMNVPQVVRVLETIRENDTAYIVMDFVEGITLKQKLKNTGVMPVVQILSLLGPIAAALDQVHKDGIIHRDISPDNIMLDRNDQARLLDLGAAKEIDMRSDRDKQSSQLIHKDGFSPPEQYTSGSPIGPWTDVYALSATVYYCMTGMLVPSAMDRLYNGTAVAFPAGFPENIRKALEKGLSLKVKDRYQTVGELWAALTSKQPEPKPKPEPEPKPVPEPKPKTKKKAAVIGIVSGACVLAAALIFCGIRFLGGQTSAGGDGDMPALTVRQTDVAESTPEVSDTRFSDPEVSDTDSLKTDDLNWSLENGVLTISGSGDMESLCDGSYYPPWVDLPWEDSDDDKPVVTEVVIGDGVTTICDNAFYDCSELKKVTIPDSVASIGYDAFYCCKELTEITLPDGLETIEELAFSGCESLTTVTIPDGVTTIGGGAFNHGVASIRVDEDNPNYTVIDGVLYDKDLTEVVSCCQNVKNVRLPDSITTIDDYAFNNCIYLTELTIPDGLETVGRLAFYNCRALTDVYYAGSESEWNEIAIISSENDAGNNSELTNAAIHCNSDNADNTAADTAGAETSYAADTLEVGDIITFGTYEQDNDTSNGAEPIEWRVLDVQDGKALVISEYGLDAQPYNTEREDVTWQTCTLRGWLNDDFYNTAFSAGEQDMIQTTSVVNNDNSDTDGGSDTQDKVFLLSLDEAEEYFADDDDSMCVPTAYAVAQGAYTDDNYSVGGAAACWWWLRSPGRRDGSYYAAWVSNDGSLQRDGNYVDSASGCVRPAFWLNLDS